MIDIHKVAHQIKNDGLYNVIYYAVKDKLQIDEPSVADIESLLNKDHQVLRDFKEINRFSEISNIQVKPLHCDKDETQHSQSLKKQINQNIQQLKKLENFEVDSSASAYSIWIGSVGVMVIFMLHNVIALFTEFYDTHGWYVYFLFAIVIGLTYWAYHKMKQNHESKHKYFVALYAETMEMVSQGIAAGFFEHEHLYE